MKNRKIITDDTLFAGNVKFLRGIDDPGSTQMRNDIKAASDQVKTVAVRADVALAAISEANQLAMVRLVLSATAVTRSRAGAYSPAGIIVSAKGMEGVSYYGRFRVETSDDGVTYAASYASSNDESQYAYTLSTGSYIRVRLYQNGGLGTLLQEAILVVTNDSGTAPIYWGALTTAPTEGVMLNDYYFKANDAGDGGGVILYWNGTSWATMTSGHALYKEANWKALADMVSWATEQGTVIAAATAIVQKLITSDAFIENLYAMNIEVPSGGSQRWYDGQGVNRRCIEVKDGHVDFIDAPDTTPTSAEVLAFRLGRLGVTGPTILDGDCRSNIDSEWTPESVINAAISAFPSYIQLADGELRVAYRRGADNYLVERVWSGSAWDAESAINAAISYDPLYIQLIDGELRIAYRRGADNYLVERVWSGSAWDAESVINAAVSYDPSYIQLADGELRIAYRRGADGYLVERTLQRYAKIGAGIIAEGGNATTGYWTAWGNGRLEYEVSKSIVSDTLYDFGLSAPYAFIDAPRMSITRVEDTTADSFLWIRTRSATQYKIRHYAGATKTIDIIAKGRWK